MPTPPPLRRSGTIAVAAPASAPLDDARFHDGLAALRDRGLRVETPRALAPHGFLAGTDAERLGELNALLRRDDLDAVFCARGGYGTLRLLPGLDYGAARAHPKLVVGYSDITALHLALWAKAGLPGLSGPMVAPDWPAMDAASEAQFWHFAEGGVGEIVGPGGERLEGVRSGEAEGVLLGGNLTLVTALLGTPYLPDLAGAILFVEEVGEPPYRIDRLFAQLRLAGVLGRLGGLVLGAFTGAEPPPARPSLSLDEVLSHYTSGLPCPVARGLVYGHIRPKSTLPVGVRARLDVDGEAATLTVLDPVTTLGWRPTARVMASGPPTLPSSVAPMRIAGFASGGGSNLQAILDAVDVGTLAAEVGLVVSDRPGAGALDRAERAGIPTAVLHPRDFADEDAFGAALLEAMAERGVDFVALAGYLKRIPAAVVRAFPGRILNVHPSLLPAFGGPGFYGRRVHEAALAHGVKWSGATVHLVDEDYDTGPIVLQEPVRVHPGDTPDALAARVLEAEHRLYPEALRLFAAGRVRLDGRRVRITNDE